MVIFYAQRFIIITYEAFRNLIPYVFLLYDPSIIFAVDVDVPGRIIPYAIVRSTPFQAISTILQGNLIIFFSSAIIVISCIFFSKIMLLLLRLVPSNF